MDDTKTTLVFFIGGCTFAEISALRFLSKLDDGECTSCDFTVQTRVTKHLR